MSRPYDVLTFDCYGTLIDWEAGLGPAFETAARADGVHVTRQEAARAYTALEPVVEAETFRSYREVLAETARRAAATLGWCVSERQASFLPDSLKDWPPFPDTNPALERLRAAGYTLVILSNVDDDLLAGSLRQLRVPFDLTITSQQVRAYKPQPAHFEAARRWIGERRWLHVAASYFHDITPAWELGIPAVWINRRGQPLTGPARPVRVFPSLTELADWLTD